MDDVAIDGVIAAQAALIASLDSGDVARIERATSLLAAAVERARSDGAVRVSPTTADRVMHALKQSDAARTRVNFLADANRQRMARLAVRRGVEAVPTYNALGRHAV